jgi:hypothetical protein
MTTTRITLLGSALAIVVATLAAAGQASKSAVRVQRQLAFELVGQFVNSPAGVTPQTHTHYGYLSSVRGITSVRAAPPDETTALFTFYADATTVRVLANGPLRVITRSGRFTIYRDPSTNGTFSRPETFRDGTPVVGATFRQQSVLNTVTGAFTTFHQNTIVSSRPFREGGRSVQLGRRGDRFTVALNGHSNMPGPPSGFFAGYAVSEARG